MENPPVIQARTPRKVWWLAATLGAGGAATVLFQFNPVEHAFYPQCLFYDTTGLYCPGCGGLRALHSLAHGHLLAALHFNPVVVLALPVVAVAVARRVWHEAAGQPLPPLVINAAMIKFLVAGLVLFTIARNIPFAPFIWLAPP